jgi:hypothetical protein
MVMDNKHGARHVRRAASARGAAKPRSQRAGSAWARETLPDRFLILIDCATEADQVRLLARFQAEGLPCRALIS